MFHAGGNDARASSCGDVAGFPDRDRRSARRPGGRGSADAETRGETARQTGRQETRTGTDEGSGQSAGPRAASRVPGQPWLRWGGPTLDFTVPGVSLASAWPADGPPRLWTRTLGDGYSGIAEENGILYTGFRRGSDDVVTALDAQSGKTIWENEVRGALYQPMGGSRRSWTVPRCRK